jgi:hypothetical protein
MKYIITESQIDRMVFRYLDGLDMVKIKTPKFNTTRLFIKGDEIFPEMALFNAYDEVDEREGEYRLLLVDTKLCRTIGLIFNFSDYKTLGPILLRWFNEYADDNCVKSGMMHH